MLDDAERRSLLKEIDGLSVDELVNCKAAWRLLSCQPWQVPQKPGLDEIVVAFLDQHGIDVRPPEKPENPTLQKPNRAADALVGGAMGALGGPLAVGMSSHLNQQKMSADNAEKLARHAAAMSEYSAALQEWTTWKQWSLSHAQWEDHCDNWNARWHDARREALQHNERLLQWIQSEEGLQARRKLVILAMNSNKLANASAKNKAKQQMQDTIAGLGVYIFVGLAALAVSAGMGAVAAVASALGLAYVIYKFCRGRLR